MKKKMLIISIIVIILSIGCLIFKNKIKNIFVKEDIIYTTYFKVNPLINFKFKIVDEKPIITSFILENDKAKKLFKDIDFNNMELNDAINLYGDTLKKSKIEFNTIYVWTTWNNKDYFKSDKYKLNVEVVDELKIKDIPNEALPILKLNTKYYNTEDKHGLSITFKENGVLEYHLDENYVQDGCGKCTETECIICDITDDMYMESSKKKKYRIDKNYIFIEAKKGEFYDGWYKAYYKCEIMFNRIKCDNYNAFHGSVAKYQYTKYYEIRN